MLASIINQIIRCDLFKELMINRVWKGNYKIRAPYLIDTDIFNLNKGRKNVSSCSSCTCVGFFKVFSGFFPPSKNTPFR